MKRFLKIWLVIFMFLFGFVFPRQILHSQEQPVTGSIIVWSPDGTKIVLSSMYGVDLFDANLQRLPQIIAERNQLSTLAWSPDSTLLAGARYSIIDIWNVATGGLLFELNGQTDSVNSVSWSPDGRYLASGSSDGKIIIWNIAQRTIERMLFQKSGVQVLGWSPTGERLVAAGQGGISIWQPIDGSLISSNYAVGGTSSIGWSADGKHFILTDPVLFSSESAFSGGSLDCLLNISPIFSDWSKNGSRIMFSSTDAAGSSLCVLDAERQAYTQIIAIPESAPVFSFALSPDGKYFVAESSIGVLQKFETDTGTLLENGPDAVPTGTFMPTKLQLTSLCSPEPDKYRVWRVRNLNPIDVVFTWKVSQSVTKQADTNYVRAAENGVPGEVIFTTKTETSSDTVQIFSPINSLQDQKISAALQCADVTLTPSITPSSFHLNAICSAKPDLYRVWQIANATNVDVIFNWQVVGTTQSGIGLAKASSDTTFQTSTIIGAPNTVRILVNGAVQDTQNSNSLKCGAASPTPTATFTPTLTLTPTLIPTSTAVVSLLKLTSLCSSNPATSRVWRVRNANGSDIPFTWDVYGTSQKGSGVAKANSDTIFQTSTVPNSPNTVRIFVNKVQQDVKASGGAQCATPTPTMVPHIADLSLTMIVTDATPTISEVINYVITYGNHGPDTANNVKITSPLPAGVTLQSANGGSYNPTTGVCTMGDVINGQNATISLQVQVNAGTAGQSFTANASISADSTDPNATNNSASASLTVRQ